jgi:cytokinin dehydrogenase
VKWIRAFYDDFETFTSDQELLVSMPDLVDYVEGFKVLNEQSLHSTSVGFPGNIGFLPDFGTKEKPKVYYCIEFAVHDYQLEHINVDEVRSFDRNSFYVSSHNGLKLILNYSCP